MIHHKQSSRSSMGMCSFKAYTMGYAQLEGLLLLLLGLALPATYAFAPGMSQSRRSSLTLLKGDTDVETLLAKSTFPIQPDDLISLAKEAFLTKGMGLKDDGACLAGDFQFRAAFVETNREDFFKALKSFNLEDSFAITQNFFGWMVDPLQPNRVWVMNRQEAVHVGAFAGVEPTQKVLVMPPQCYHVDFNEAGKVTEFGFYTVDRAQGNTGGLGGAFGYFYGVGRPLPFPEGKPYKRSFRMRIFQMVGKILSKLTKKKKE